MRTRHVVIVSFLALGVWVGASCAHRSRSSAPPADQLAVGEVPGAVPVIPPGPAAVPPPGALRSVPPPGTPSPDISTTIAPMPVPGEDSAATARRKMMNLPKFGDYVHVTELPEAIEKAAPAYPDAARQAGVSGTVMVQVLVLADGSVADTRVVKSIPPLDDAAVSCVRKWRFKPARNAQGPTAVWVGIPVTFTLH